MKRISDKAVELINRQIKREEESSRLYLTFSTWLDFNGWYGAAGRYRDYATEELTHRDKFISFLQDRDVLPEIPALDKPANDNLDIEKIIQATYEHEIFVTTSISEIKTQAFTDKDFVLIDFLDWFITEQISEEAKALYFVDRLKMFKNTNASLYHLDKEFKEYTGA